MTIEINLEDALKQHFGFDGFNDGQQDVIRYLLEGHSTLAVFPTGGGKSLCYQLPALLMPGLTLVVSPLIALMKDQIDALQKRGIAAARLDSSLSADDYRDVLRQARSGSLRLLYVAPERFNNELFRAMIDDLPIALIAIDEAHCISEWGHNFRPDYLKLPEFAKRCGAERVLALTATATPKVQEDICRAFNIKPEHACCTGFYRANLTVLTTAVSVDKRDVVLLSRLQGQVKGPSIIYVTKQQTAEAVAEYLVQENLPARAYHAGMNTDIRSDTQDWFMSSDDAIVVATIAFGMGVDKSNIRYVYHYNLPKSLENFAQEIGRAGRDGKSSNCEMFVCMDDLNVLENFIYGDTPVLSSLVNLVDELFSYDNEFDINLYSLSSAHDIRILVLRTFLTYLEIDGYLESGTPFYSSYRFKPLQDSPTILNHFEGERRDFIANLFRQSKKARTLFTIDIDQTALTIGSTRDRIVRALDYLGEQNFLDLRATGVRNRYRILKTPESHTALASQLHKRAIEREKSEVKRLQQVLDLASLHACQVNSLAAYFGDHREQPCGHCSWCLHEKSVTSSTQTDVVIDEQIWQRVSVLRSETPLLQDPHILARFLCGVSSPHLSRAKLASHPLFGVLSDVPFQQILTQTRR